MAYINGKSILFSPIINISHFKAVIDDGEGNAYAQGVKLSDDENGNIVITAICCTANFVDDGNGNIILEVLQL